MGLGVRQRVRGARTDVRERDRYRVLACARKGEPRTLLVPQPGLRLALRHVVFARLGVRMGGEEASGRTVLHHHRQHGQDILARDRQRGREACSGGQLQEDSDEPRERRPGVRPAHVEGRPGLRGLPRGRARADGRGDGLSITRRADTRKGDEQAPRSRNKAHDWCRLPRDLQGHHRQGLVEQVVPTPQPDTRRRDSPGVPRRLRVLQSAAPRPGRGEGHSARRQLALPVGYAHGAAPLGHAEARARQAEGEQGLPALGRRGAVRRSAQAWQAAVHTDEEQHVLPR